MHAPRARNVDAARSWFSGVRPRCTTRTRRFAEPGLAAARRRPRRSRDGAATRTGAPSSLGDRLIARGRARARAPTPPATGVSDPAEPVARTAPASDDTRRVRAPRRPRARAHLRVRAAVLLYPSAATRPPRRSGVVTTPTSRSRSCSPSSFAARSDAQGPSAHDRLARARCPDRWYGRISDVDHPLRARLAHPRVLHARRRDAVGARSSAARLYDPRSGRFHPMLGFVLSVTQTRLPVTAALQMYDKLARTVHARTRRPRWRGTAAAVSPRAHSSARFGDGTSAVLATEDVRAAVRVDRRDLPPNVQARARLPRGRASRRSCSRAASSPSGLCTPRSASRARSSIASSSRPRRSRCCTSSRASSRASP